ncbi:MAG: hypothetical protein ACFCVE_01070 [Phycisphaerae bacterium]
MAQHPTTPQTTERDTARPERRRKLNPLTIVVGAALALVLFGLLLTIVLMDHTGRNQDGIPTRQAEPNEQGLPDPQRQGGAAPGY